MFYCWVSQNIRSEWTDVYVVSGRPSCSARLSADRVAKLYYLLRPHHVSLFHFITYLNNNKNHIYKPDLETLPYLQIG